LQNKENRAVKGTSDSQEDKSGQKRSKSQ